MKLGVFAKTYERPSVDQAFEAAARDGFSCVQFNLACSGLNTLPDEPVPEAITFGDSTRCWPPWYRAGSGFWHFQHGSPASLCSPRRR